MPGLQVAPETSGAVFRHSNSASTKLILNVLHLPRPGSAHALLQPGPEPAKKMARKLLQEPPMPEPAKRRALLQEPPMVRLAATVCANASDDFHCVVMALALSTDAGAARAGEAPQPAAGAAHA